MPLWKKYIYNLFGILLNQSSKLLCSILSTFSTFPYWSKQFFFGRAVILHNSMCILLDNIVKIYCEKYFTHLYHQNCMHSILITHTLFIWMHPVLEIYLQITLLWVSLHFRWWTAGQEETEAYQTGSSKASEDWGAGRHDSVSGGFHQ